MNITEVEKSCFGCAGCVDICPVEALKIVKDENGFYVPSLQAEQCIDCGKCVKSCPALYTEAPTNSPSYYYGWHTDEAIRAASSSGGLFRGLADWALIRNGVVFGAKYSTDFHVVEMASTEDCAVDALQKSKYVQANAAGLYRAIRKQLSNGKKVLLTGTPCQIAAARNIFGQNENLILLDFLCGGVPSPDYYDQYIEWLEKKYGSKVESVDFRSKENGWSRSTVHVKFQNGKRYCSGYEYDPYYALFYLTSQTKNEACLECKFTTKRSADITIADFWGFRKLGIPNDEKGMSLVVAHTTLGKRILSELDRVNLIPLEEKDGSYDFVPRKISAEKKKQRDLFLGEFKRHGFIKAAYKGFFKFGKYGVVLRKIKGRVKGLFE